VTAVPHRFAGGRVLQKLPAWQWYLFACAVPAALAPFFLASEWSHAAINVSIAYASAAIAVWRFRTGRGVPVAWLWIGAGAALNATGGISESITEQVFHSDAYPTPADGFYLAIYPCVSVGLLMIVRHRNPGIGTLKLDLSQLPAGAPATVPASVGIGELRIVVPSDGGITVDSHVEAGAIDALGRHDDGTDVRLTTGTGNVLTVVANVGAGQIEVVRAP